MRTAVIKDSPWAVSIGGFRARGPLDPKGVVKEATEAAAPQLAQLLDADGVAGYDHLLMAAVNAARSTETGLSVSKSITVEALLYASAQDQITKALGMMGLSGKSNRIALMVFASNPKEAEAAYRRVAVLLGDEDDAALEIDAGKREKLRKAYGVSDAELEAAGGADALGRLIVERGALLSLRR